MKIISRDSIGLTIRFSWRELKLLGLILHEFKTAFKGPAHQDCARFCTALVNKIAAYEADNSEDGQ